MLRLDPVRYEFSIVGAPMPSWHVRHLLWTEGLSETYEIIVELTTDAEDVQADNLLGNSVELTIERNGLIRTGYGIVHHVDDLGATADRRATRVYVVPAFELLAQRVDTRIFQGQTVPEVLDAVLGPALAEYEREADISSHLEGRYDARDYCVQFRESDFDFCCRLMEEEGIAYYFASDDENSREKLILIDNNDAYEDVPLLIDEEVPIIADRFEEADRESLRCFGLERSERPTKVTARGFNWKVPQALDEGQVGGQDTRDRVREEYLFDDRRQIVDDPLNDPRAESFTGEGLPQRSTVAVRHLQSRRHDGRRGSGESNVTGFAAGLRFRLGQHRRDDLEHHIFLLSGVVHEGDAPEEQLGATDASGPRYSNRFGCVPIKTPFRPRLQTPKPRVYGPQTAIVMGPSDDPNEDIHTDPHGRVKVRFHWDRLSPADESASCWIRVAQSWAGSGWGSLFIPRVGMEVVVEFLDGNPDRPLVTGCVYNGTQTPPYSLPSEKTRSTIKSESSPGGGGYNELRFDDAKGNEEIFVHAQKNLNEVILNDHSTSVSVNHSTSVGGDQSTSVTGDRTISVSGNQSTSVTGDQSMTVSGAQTITVTKNRKLTVTGSQSIQVIGSAAQDGVQGSKLDITGDYKLDTSNTVALQAPTQITLTCGGSTLTMVPGKITLCAGGNAQLVLDANALMSSAGGSIVQLDANALVQSNAGSMLQLDANALVQSSGGSMVELDANALMSSPSEATVTAPTAALVGAGGSVEAAASGLTCAGGKVDVSGGTVNILGALVKIN